MILFPAAFQAEAVRGSFPSGMADISLPRRHTNHSKPLQQNAKGERACKKWKNSIFLLLFLIGLGLILYPIVSSKVEDWSHSKAIADYRSQVAENAAQLEQKKEEARAYNGQLAQPAAQADGQEPTAGYYSLLSFQDVMGYLEIPEIGVNLPIYHGTSDLVLEMGVGHLESSSLPIGGESTHAVLMGHRGLPSSTLFNKLPKLKEGAQFYIHMLEKRSPMRWIKSR